jgi:hypothetical protein
MQNSLRTRMPAYSDPQESLEESTVPETSAKVHPLDGDENQKRFRLLQEWWAQARESQAISRLEMDIDDSFYHGDQFSAEDRQALEDVGQAPLVFNKIKPVIDWIIGTERRTRVDFNVLPRKRGLEEQAQMKKDVMKYISDTSKMPFAKSESFKETAISGLGWLEAGVNGNERDEPIYVRHESWRNIWYDALGSAKDTSDWRYLFRSKSTDLDIAQGMFPDRKADLISCATSVGIDLTMDGDDEFYLGQRFTRRDSNGSYVGMPSYTDMLGASVNNRRSRVRLVECWYRMPTHGQKVKGGRHHGRIVNLKNQRMMHELNAEVEKDIASTYNAVIMQVRCAVFCENILLQDMESPYHHNRFPFVPIFAYRKGKFHQPYGPTRNMRDPQEDLNKRYSKALFLLSSTRIIADRNAVQDWETLRSEVGRPDAQLLLDKKDARFEIHTEQVLAEEHVKLMHNDGIHIMESGGVTPENMGRDTNAMSGKAVLAKQTQGSVVTAELFDNLRYSNQLLGEIVLSLAEQFIDQEKAVRITGERGEIQWRDVNTPGENGEVVNDITATQMDYIIAEQDFRDTMRQAMFESLSDIVSKMPPEMGIKILDVVVDLSDFPGKKELIDRIRKMNGQMPPEAQMTDEQKQEAQAVQQKQAEQEQLQQKAVMLDLEEKAAKVKKINAEADKLLAEMGQGDGGADIAALRDELMTVKQKSAEAAIKAEGTLAEMKTKLADNNHQINVKAATAIAEAHIKQETDIENAETAAEASIEAARLQAEANERVGLSKLNREIDSLGDQLKEATKKAQSKKSATAPPKKKAA